VPALTLAVVAIALPDSLNPSLILAAVYLAVGPHPFRRTLVFTIAAFLATLAGGLLIAVGLGDVILSLLPKLSHAAKWRVLTAVGVALVLGGVAIWVRRRSLGAGEPPSRHPPAPRGTPAVLMGASIAGVELLTAFPYFAAIAMIVGSSVSTGAKIFLIVIYNVVYVLPLIAVVVVCAVMGERAGRFAAPIGDWIALNWPLVAAPLCCAAGIALTAYGAVQLL
jgi:hypothetical protein